MLSQHYAKCISLHANLSITKCCFLCTGFHVSRNPKTFHFISFLKSDILIVHDQGLDLHQNLINSSLSHTQHVHQVSSKSIHNFLRYPAHKQRQTDTERDENITSFTFGGRGNYDVITRAPMSS